VGEGFEGSRSIASNGAEEAFFDGDADGATDRHLAAVEEGLEGVLLILRSVRLFYGLMISCCYMFHLAGDNSRNRNIEGP